MMRHLWFTTGLFATLLGMASGAGAAEPHGMTLSVNSPSQAQKSDPITHEVDFSVIVTPPYHCHVLKVWLPLPQSDDVQEISGRELSTFPDQVEPQIATEPVYGNQFAYFEFHDPQGAQIIRHRFTAKLWDLHWNVDPQKVAHVSTWPSEFHPYLQPQTIADQAGYDQLVRQIIPQSQGAANDLGLVMSWIENNLTYDHTIASLQADANHALRERRGHCSDYHGLCATIGRSLGYPARVTYGLALMPKNSPSHCKMEAYLPPYGWVSYDVSETQKMIESIGKNAELSEPQREQLIAAARHRLAAGFRENSWLLVTRGTHYDLAPKASRPAEVVRTAFVEADGEVLPEPDPADITQRQFSWMTAHRYESDRPFKLPFKDLSTLEVGAE